MATLKLNFKGSLDTTRKSVVIENFDLNVENSEEETKYGIELGEKAIDSINKTYDYEKRREREISEFNKIIDQAKETTRNLVQRTERRSRFVEDLMHEFKNRLVDERNKLVKEVSNILSEAKPSESKDVVRRRFESTSKDYKDAIDIITDDNKDENDWD